MRIRVTFSKTEAMRYTGHLDLHRAWERTFRRANLPLAYSQGFHPQPRLNLASALPLGLTSQCELLDAWLEIPQPIDQVFTSLANAAPPGIQLSRIEEITERLPALQTQVTSADYTVTLLDSFPDLDERLVNLTASQSLSRQRRGKDYDLRPLIENIALLPADQDGQQRFHLRLSAREAATGRPEEVLAVLAIPIEAARIHRTALILHTDA
jgi:radical SAM-linked protein